MPTALSSFLIVHLSFKPITYHFCMATHGHAWLHLAHPTLMPISCPFLAIHIHTHVNEAPCKFHETPMSRVSCCLLGSGMRPYMVICVLPGVHGLRAIALVEKWGFVLRLPEEATH